MVPDKALMTDKTIQAEIKSYLKSLSDSYAKGDATEHTYRPAFQYLLQAVLPEAKVTNEPKQIECGAPDFVLSHNNIPRGYIEAKDLDKIWMMPASSNNSAATGNHLAT